jgi:hypothetical protein
VAHVRDECGDRRAAADCIDRQRHRQLAPLTYPVGDV